MYTRHCTGIFDFSRGFDMGTSLLEEKQIAQRFVDTHLQQCKFLLLK